MSFTGYIYNDVIIWRHFPRYWPFVMGIRRSTVDSPHKRQWRGALKFSLTYARTNDWTNNRDASELRRHRAHYDVTIMSLLVMDLCDKIQLSTSCTHISLNSLSVLCILRKNTLELMFNYKLITLLLAKCDDNKARLGPNKLYETDRSFSFIVNIWNILNWIKFENRIW